MAFAGKTAFDRDWPKGGFFLNASAHSFPLSLERNRKMEKNLHNPDAGQRRISLMTPFLWNLDIPQMKKTVYNSPIRGTRQLDITRGNGGNVP